MRTSRFTPLILTSLTGDHSELICSLFTFSCPSRNLFIAPIFLIFLKSYFSSILQEMLRVFLSLSHPRHLIRCFGVVCRWACWHKKWPQSPLLLTRPQKKWSKSPLTQKCEYMYINWNTSATGMVQFCSQYQCSKSEKAAERNPNLFFKRIKTTIWSKKTQGAWYGGRHINTYIYDLFCD